MCSWGTTSVWVARYWAESLAGQQDDSDLAAQFTPIAGALADAESAILAEMVECQGESQDIGGYYQPDETLAVDAMRPSGTFNLILSGVFTEA